MMSQDWNKYARNLAREEREPERSGPSTKTLALRSFLISLGRSCKNILQFVNNMSIAEFKSGVMETQDNMDLLFLVAPS